MKTYQFDQGDAIQYGVNEAIFLWRLRWWLRENRIKGRNQRDGRTWSYDNAADLSQIFKFWSEHQIRRIIASLVEQKAVMKGNFNQKANDHTLWLALCDESVLEVMDAGVADAGGTGATPGRQREGKLASPTKNLASRNRQAKPDARPDGIASPADDSASRPDGIAKSYKEHLEDSTSEDSVQKKQQQQSAQDTAKAHAAAAAGGSPSGLGGGTGFGGDPALEGIPHSEAEGEEAEAVGAILTALATQGVETSANLVRSLIREHGRRAVADQVRWLPQRGKGHRLRILRAALKDDYEDPDADPLARLAQTPPAPPEARTRDGRVTRIGTCPLKNRDLLSEIRKHGLPTVQKELTDHHDRCRRGDTPDGVLSKQCEMIDFLTSATAGEIDARLSGPK